MTTIKIKTKQLSYPVYIGTNNILHTLPSEILKLSKTKKVIFISTEALFKFYGNRIKAQFDQSWNIESILICDQEKNKSLQTAEGIIKKLHFLQADRHSVLIALGGGVIGDITGFVASIYLRGIDYIAIPTTLLAQVDSSVGGKCGVNLSQAKNMIGSFYHPKAVFSDTQFLKTLSHQNFHSGMGEVIKYSLIRKSILWNMLHLKQKEIFNRNHQVLHRVICACIKIKKYFIEADERDKAQRQTLNLGHTYAHALEAQTKYKSLAHGHAVAQGLYFALNLSLKKKMCTRSTEQKIKKLLCKYDFLEQKHAKNTLNWIASDKKRQNNELNWVLIEDVGKTTRSSLNLHTLN
jgi:3-dehydroquinate synthase